MAGTVPRCQVVPLPDDQISMTVDGREVTRWHFGARYPRPFFFPVIGPGGSTLTRMGHPGDPSHDHHRSVWLAHEKVSGIDFWSDRTQSQVRQLEWLAFAGGEDEAVMAVRLGWFDGHDPQELMVQELVAAVRPSEDMRAWQLELQSTFTPRAESLELGQTNFGMIAVRVAESVSAYFGGGTITGADGKVGEPALFGQPNHWMDYSGPVRKGDGSIGVEGITLHDHPLNVNHPAKWHVREAPFFYKYLVLREMVDRDPSMHDEYVNVLLSGLGSFVHADQSNALYGLANLKIKPDDVRTRLKARRKEATDPGEISRIDQALETLHKNNAELP